MSGIATREPDDQPNLLSCRFVFESVTCDDCGHTGPVSRTCECGAWQAREDEHVARRRTAVSALIHRVDEPGVPSQPLEIQEALAVLGSWIDGLFNGLAIFGEKGGSAAALEESVDALLVVRDRAAAVPRRRPWLAVWDPLRETIDQLRLLAAVYLKASTESDPDVLPAAEAAGQDHLNAAAEAIRTLNDRMAWWGIETTIRLPNSIVTAVSAAYDATGAQNVVDLDVHGLKLYERITGRRDGPRGIGVGLLIDLGQVGRAFDERRVYEVAAEVYRRLDGHRDHLVTLLDDEGWRTDLLNARRVFYEAQLATETLLRELAGERRVEVEAVLHLGSRLTERVSACLVGLVVAADPSQRVKRTSDYSAMHQAARRLGLGDILLGFDDRIRNADAHADFDVEAEHVLLARNRSRSIRLHDDDLVDIVLSAVESSGAIFAGIDCVLAELDHPSVMDRFGDLPITDRIAILLAVTGVVPERIRMSTGRIEVNGQAHRAASVSPLSVVASLEPYMPTDIHTLHLRLLRKGATLFTKAPLQPLRRFRSGQGIAKEVSLVEFFAKTTINGRPVISHQHTRFLAAVYAHRYIDVPYSEAAADLRLLVTLARRLDDSELVSCMLAFVEAKSAREGGPPAPKAAKAHLARLAGYLAKPPGPWNDGSPLGPGPLAPA
jgi:hypothetical protein